MIRVENKIVVTPWSIESRSGSAVIVNAVGEPVQLLCCIAAADENRLEHIVHAVNNIEEITKQRDQLLDALRECITNDGAHCLAYGADTPTLRARLAAISKVARAAITQAERGAK